jgi:hypothetical protein
VEDSRAYASFNDVGEVTLEGVHWPAISADIVQEARKLRDIVLDLSAHATLRANIKQKGFPELGNLDGRVQIVHTPSIVRDKVVARAVYRVHARGQGKVALLTSSWKQIRRLEDRVQDQA